METQHITESSTCHWRTTMWCSGYFLVCLVSLWKFYSFTEIPLLSGIDHPSAVGLLIQIQGQIGCRGRRGEYLAVLGNKANDMVPHAVPLVHGNGIVICLDAGVQLLSIFKPAACLKLASFESVHFLQHAAVTLVTTFLFTNFCGKKLQDLLDFLARSLSALVSKSSVRLL